MRFDINYLFQHLVSICCKNKAILLKNWLIELFTIVKEPKNLFPSNPSKIISSSIEIQNRQCVSNKRLRIRLQLTWIISVYKSINPNMNPMNETVQAIEWYRFGIFIHPYLCLYANEVEFDTKNLAKVCSVCGMHFIWNLNSVGWKWWWNWKARYLCATFCQFLPQCACVSVYDLDLTVQIQSIYAC